MENAMSPNACDQTERLVQFSRRQLWSVLVFLLIFGSAWLVDLVVPAHVPWLVCIPVAIALCVVAPLRTRDIDMSPHNPAMKALRNDELRQSAQARAFRNGFFVLLAYPPVCAFALTGLAVPNPLPLVVASGAWLGAVAFLASLLWYDR
jgi:hypothetical protein